MLLLVFHNFKDELFSIKAEVLTYLLSSNVTRFTIPGYFGAGVVRDTYLSVGIKSFKK